MISHAWTIEEFKVNEIDRKEDIKKRILIKTPEITIQERGTVILPKLKDYSPPKDIGIHDKWKYIRKKFGEGQIEIIDLHQNYFSGVYDIEILQIAEPMQIRLYSDSIEFILREQSFLNSPVIPH